MVVGVALLLFWGAAALSRVRGDVVRSLGCEAVGLIVNESIQTRCPQHSTCSMIDFHHES